MHSELNSQSFETEQFNIRLERILDLTEGSAEIRTAQDELMFLEGSNFYFDPQAEIFDWKLKSAVEIYLQDRTRLENLLVNIKDPESKVELLSDEQLIDFIQFLFAISKNLKDQFKKATIRSSQKQPKEEKEFIYQAKSYFFVEGFPRLEQIKAYSLKLFKIKAEENPEILRLLVKILHSQKRTINDELIDEILDIPTDWDYPEAGEGPEFLYTGTKYDLIKQILNSDLFPKQGTSYDVGAGYGRFVIYKALLDNQPVRAVEKQSKRAKFLQERVKKFKIHNLKVLEQDATTVNYSDGDVFYLYNPFGNNKELEQAFLRQLLKTTTGKKVKIFWFGGFVSKGKVDGKRLKSIKDENLEKALVKIFET